MICVSRSMSWLPKLLSLDFDMQNEIPALKVGKYKGIPVDQLPMSYLKWILSKDFPEEIKKYARNKVTSNNTVTLQMEVTRHAYDKFSLLFLSTYFDRKDRTEGIGSYLARMATEAHAQGKDVSKHRHEDDELVKEYKGVKYVFNRKGEQKILITVMN